MVKKTISRYCPFKGGGKGFRQKSDPGGEGGDQSCGIQGTGGCPISTDSFFWSLKHFKLLPLDFWQNKLNKIVLELTPHISFKVHSTFQEVNKRVSPF
jgi:hypothetical protein